MGAQLPFCPLQAFHSDFPVFESLDFSGNGLRDEACEALLEALCKDGRRAHLVVLDLSHNGLTCHKGGGRRLL